MTQSHLDLLDRALVHSFYPQIPQIAADFWRPVSLRRPFRLTTPPGFFHRSVAARLRAAMRRAFLSHAKARAPMTTAMAMNNAAMAILVVPTCFRPQAAAALVPMPTTAMPVMTTRGRMKQKL